MRTEHHTKQLQAKFLDAYKRNNCIISRACEEIDMDRKSFYDWMKKDEDFKKEFEEAEPLQVEFVESQLMKRIKEGSDSSIQFYLKTKGKKYGYGTNIDITSNGGALIPTIIKLIEVKGEEDESIGD